MKSGAKSFLCNNQKFVSLFEKELYIHEYATNQIKKIDLENCKKGKLFARKTDSTQEQTSLYLRCPRCNEMPRRDFLIQATNLLSVNNIPANYDQTLNNYNLKLKNYKYLSSEDNIKALILEKGQPDRLVDINAKLYPKTANSATKTDNGFLVNFSRDLFNINDSEFTFKNTLPFGPRHFDQNLEQVINSQTNFYNLSSNYNYDELWVSNNSYLRQFMTDNNKIKNRQILKEDERTWRKTWSCKIKCLL